MTEIKFSLLQSALEPYQTLKDALSATGATGSTFDLMMTPIKGENGATDSLTLELSKNNAYGIVQLKNGVTVQEGSGLPVLINSAMFNALPKNLSPDLPIEFRIADRVYVKYPDNPQMSDTKFDFEYSDNPEVFLRRPTLNPVVGFNPEATKTFAAYLNSASMYVFKKRTDEPLSVILVNLTAKGSATITATTLTEAFYAEVQLEGFTNLADQTDINCMLLPAVWQAGAMLGNKTKKDLYLGFDQSNVTFLSDNIAFTHSLMNFPEYPTIGNEIKDWVQTKTHEVFSAKINPSKLYDTLKYLESIGLAARAMEPSFVMTQDNGKPFIKLKGYMSSGSSRILDPQVLNVNWVSDQEIRLPARVMLQVLNTAEQHYLQNFFDLEGIPGVLFMNDEKTCFVLMSQESAENV
jgi:hypothetical protein